MYVAGEAPKIFISADRPHGRRNFTCAHELGHHVLGHGQQFDELSVRRKQDRKKDLTELCADAFASYFLMPKTLLDSALKRRAIAYDALTPQDVYALSCWLGVGYTTLIAHLEVGLRTITSPHALRLRKERLPQLRASFIGRPLSNHLHVVDQHWTGAAVDCEAGDVLLVPEGARTEGVLLTVLGSVGRGDLLQITQPGIARISNSSWAVFVRASRKRYVGRGRYRFEEEVLE